MKKKSYNKVGILLMFVVLFACQGNAGRKTADDSAQSPRQEQAVEPQFPFPSIPSTLTEPEERNTCCNTIGTTLISPTLH